MGPNTRNWVVALSALAVVSVGSYWLWTRAAGGETPVAWRADRSPVASDQEGFQRAGTFVARGRVVRDLGPDPATDRYGLILVSDPQRRPVDAYRILRDGALRVVHADGAWIPFAVLEVVNPSALPAVATGRVLEIRGTYGSAGDPAVLSRPGLGHFVVRVRD